MAPCDGLETGSGVLSLKEKGSAMTEQSLGLGRCSRVAAVLAFAALPLLGSTALAQDSTPEAMAQSGEAPHPAHIHSGSCEELGDVVVPLTDIAEREGEHGDRARAMW